MYSSCRQLTCNVNIPGTGRAAGSSLTDNPEKRFVLIDFSPVFQIRNRIRRYSGFGLIFLAGSRFNEYGSETQFFTLQNYFTRKLFKFNIILIILKIYCSFQNYRYRYPNNPEIIITNIS